MAAAGFSPSQGAKFPRQSQGLLAALTIKKTFIELTEGEPDEEALLQYLDMASPASSRGLFRSASEPTLCLPQSEPAEPSPKAEPKLMEPHCVELPAQPTPPKFGQGAIAACVYNSWASLSHDFDSASEPCTDADTVSLCEDEINDEECGQRVQHKDKELCVPQIPAPPPAVEPCGEEVPTPPPAVHASMEDVPHSYEDPIVQPGEWTESWISGGGAEQGWNYDQFPDPSWGEMDFHTAMHMAFQWGQAHGMSVAGDLAFQHHERQVEPGSALGKLRQTGALVQWRLAGHAEPDRDEEEEQDEEGQSGSEGSVTGASRARCQVIWCDQRAFKSASAPLKASLEARVGQPVKAHKSADKCLRFLRKKRHVRGRPPCVFLLSYCNARALLENLEEVQHLVKAVVVLVDAARNTALEAQEKLADIFAETTVAASWDEAVAAVQVAVRSSLMPSDGMEPWLSDE